MSAKGWLDGAPPAVQAAQRRLATIRRARTRGLYHHRVHGPERATPPARVARAPGDLLARPAAHRGPGALTRRARSARPSRALGHGRGIRDRAAAPPAPPARPPPPPDRRLPMEPRRRARLGAR